MARPVMPHYIEWLRSHLGPRPAIVATAAALICDEQGRILFQHRTDFDWWGLPGGILEIGETLAECCIREIHEETGLTVEPVRLVGLYTGPQYNVLYPNGDAVQQWSAAFECRVLNGPARADDVETRALAYFGEALPPTARWYADMARDARAGRAAAFFEAPRAPLPNGRTDFIGQLRPLVGHARFIAPAAAAILRDERGRLLLARRADNGYWNPPGGFMDLGESIAETVVREVREEVGLVVEPIRLIGVYSGLNNQVTYPNGDEIQGCASLFECRVTGGDRRVDDDEITEVGFFSLDALPDPLPARWHQRLADLAANHSYAVFH